MADDFQAVYFADLIEHQAEVLGDKTYIHFEEEKVSFAEYYRATCRAANGLAAQGDKLNLETCSISMDKHNRPNVTCAEAIFWKVL